MCSQPEDSNGNIFNIYPNWSHGITLTRTANQAEIIDIVDIAMAKYFKKLKESG